MVMPEIPGGWQPIATAPKDGTDILVLINSATVWVVHIARWEVDDPEVPEDLRFAEGWWSYIRHSVTQEMLNGYSEPLWWQPFIEPERSW